MVIGILVNRDRLVLRPLRADVRVRNERATADEPRRGAGRAVVVPVLRGVERNAEPLASGNDWEEERLTRHKRPVEVDRHVPGGRDLGLAFRTRGGSTYECWVLGTPHDTMRFA